MFHLFQLTRQFEKMPQTRLIHQQICNMLYSKMVQIVHSYTHLSYCECSRNVSCERKVTRAYISSIGVLGTLSLSSPRKCTMCAWRSKVMLQNVKNFRGGGIVWPKAAQLSKHLQIVSKFVFKVKSICSALYDIMDDRVENTICI